MKQIHELEIIKENTWHIDNFYSIIKEKILKGEIKMSKYEKEIKQLE